MSFFGSKINLYGVVRRPHAVAMMTINTMASRRYERQQETHFQVMRLIHDNLSISTREIAFRLGISNGGAHYCIKSAC